MEQKKVVPDKGVPRKKTTELMNFQIGLTIGKMKTKQKSNTIIQGGKKTYTREKKTHYPTQRGT